MIWLIVLPVIVNAIGACAAPSPNIVFIFVDDQGYYDLSCYGATEVKTPRIDAMAQEGTRFTDYYAAAPICSPSRAGLLTGCYPRRVGNETWVHRADSRSGIHPDELTIAAIHDCKAAVRFLRANAKAHGIDSDNIGAIGLSAGGHLTALLATSAGAKELEGEGGHEQFNSAIQAAVPMGAQTDFLSERTRTISAIEERGRIWRQFLGGAQEDKPATYRLASPLQHLDKKDPPCWFITGETDDLSTHADEFRRRMDEVGIQSGLTVLKDAPHPFLGKQVWFDEMIEVADAFFTKHLKNQKSALSELGIADEVEPQHTIAEKEE